MKYNQNHLERIYLLLKIALVCACAILIGTTVKGQTVETFQVSGNHTFRVPAGVTQITVEAWGGGGAGGGAAAGRGGGGAGGAYVKKIITVSAGTDVDYYVAAAKSSTYNSTQQENKGNPSWFASPSTVYADGGAGGAPGLSGNGAGGSGSITTSIGTTRYQGGNGTNAANSSGGTGGGGAGSGGAGGNASSFSGGLGTSEFGGNGGGVVGNNTPGAPGITYGGGGSGAHSNNNSQREIGGAGAQGMIRITYTVNNQLTATATTTASCQGITPGTGTITVTASGGTAPYQYRLGSGAFQSSNVFTAVSAGTYTITVRDNNSALFTINNVVVGSQSSTMAPLTADVVDASCNIPTGSINVNNIPTALTFSKARSTYVDLGGSLLNNLSQFTLEGWIKIDKSMISGERTWGLFGQNDAVEFGIMNSSTLQLWTANGGAVNIPMSNYPNDNQWHHIAGVGTGTALIVYIDGVVVTGTGTQTATSNYGASAFNSMIGGNIWDATGNFLDGSILKTAFWSRALSASEIANIVNTPFTQYSSTQNGLIAGYNYFEGAGLVLNEEGSATTSGTLVNSPQWTEVFTYSWTKVGDPSFTSSTKNLSSVLPGTYKLSAYFPGLCPATGTWIVNSNGINVWTGSISTDWNNVSNWSCTIPDLTLDAIIPSGLTRYPLLNTGSIGMCKNIVIYTGASVTVLNNTLQIAGTIQNTGFFDATQGTIELRGTAAQTIPAASFSGNAVRNLTINNSNGVALNGTLYIYGILKATVGTFNTNGFLTLLSTPVQTALIDGSGLGSVTGNVTIQRYLPSAFGYKYFSSPFTNASVAQYSQEIDLNAAFASMYYYNENVVSTGWKAYVTSTAPLVPGTGYALNFGTAGTPITVSVSGTVNNGTVGPLTLFNNNHLYTKGYNLVGNPYPSPIDWNAAGWTKTNIDNAIYYFDAGTTDQYVGTYSTYINGVSSNGIATNIIASQQAFFVHVSDGAYPVQGTLTFTNSVRSNNLNPLFHKHTQVEDQSLIRISATSQGSQNADFMVLYVNDYANESFNKELDALKLKNTDLTVPDLFVLSNDGREISIKSIPHPVDTYTINLGFSSKVNGQVTLKATDLVNVAEGFRVYLKDSYTGHIQDLAVYPEYSFTSNKETTTNRFKIIFSREDLTSVSAEESFTAYSKNGNVIVKLNVADRTMVVQLADLKGQIITRQQLTAEGEWSLGSVRGKQVYLVSLFTGNGITSKKVYVD